ncbi:hypothetical protein AB0B56_02405 [Streptosporangium canum]|uniref:hypothetical protein n=1 Tax=Streptosporangium canum TaxID=324952 RepID=UPI00343CFC3D
MIKLRSALAAEALMAFALIAPAMMPAQPAGADTEVVLTVHGDGGSANGAANGSSGTNGH